MIDDRGVDLERLNSKRTQDGISQCKVFLSRTRSANIIIISLIQNTAPNTHNLPSSCTGLTRWRSTRSAAAVA